MPDIQSKSDLTTVANLIVFLQTQPQDMVVMTGMIGEGGYNNIKYSEELHVRYKPMSYCGDYDIVWEEEVDEYEENEVIKVLILS